MRVTHAYGDQESTNTMMTTKAIFASFHSVLIDCCWRRADFLTWEPSFSTSLLGREEGEGGGGGCSQRNAELPELSTEGPRLQGHKSC